MALAKSRGRRWQLSAAIALPVLTLTAYLLWIWPWPPSVSFWAELLPYAASLLTGLPFAVVLARGPGRVWSLAAYLLGGFIALWVYAMLVLCGARGICL